jgi:predicted alpha/beta-hydrolase family hydrolase
LVTPVNLLSTGPAEADVHLILAHGAGAPMTSPFMDAMATLLAQRDIRVTRFEFAYMAARREGARKPPPKAERLVAEYRAAVESVSQKLGAKKRLFIGGKSMGGRVASLIAGDLYGERVISGCICLGYPFHPPKKPDDLRTAHLMDLPCPTLIVQGERDPFGPRGEVESYKLSRAIVFHWATDGDHDLAPRKSSGATHGGNLEAAADAIPAFCRDHARKR